MKVIELLSKIANGEDVPKKFNFAHLTFTYNGHVITDEDGDNIFDSIFNDFSNINDEIEIIEEDKPLIEPLRTWYSCEDNFKDSRGYIDSNFKMIYEKFQDITDYINSKGDK